MKQLKEIAQRIHALREITEISAEDMAKVCGISEADYLEYEKGEKDFTFTFLYNCAKKFGVDITELMTGENPRLSLYTITRAGEGIPINRREGFKYLHKSALFKDRVADPFIVTAPYKESEQNVPIVTSRHKGQEMDYILKGSLKCSLDGHIEVLNEGDFVYYDSSCSHGMIATGGEDCVFLAVVFE